MAAKKSPRGIIRRVLGVKDATFLADTEATIKAGVDFAKLQKDAIQIEGKKIDVLLPPVEILNFSYPAEKFRINEYATNVDPLFNRLTLDEIDDFYRQAEDDIRDNFKYLGIRLTVEQKTRIMLSTLLRQLGFAEISIDFEKPEGEKPQPLNVNVENPEE